MHYQPQPWGKVFSREWGQLKIGKVSWIVDYAEDLDSRVCGGGKVIVVGFICYDVYTQFKAVMQLSLGVNGA